MRRTTLFFAVLLAIVLQSHSHAQDFEFSLDHENNIVVTNNSATDSIRLFGAEFRSTDGLLTFGSPLPFSTAFSPTNSYIPLADPGGNILLEGTVTFDVKYAGDPNDDDLSVVLSPVSDQGFASQVSASFVPEPSAGGMLCFPLAFVILLARRKR